MSNYSGKTVTATTVVENKTNSESYDTNAKLSVPIETIKNVLSVSDGYINMEGLEDFEESISAGSLGTATIDGLALIAIY